MCSSPQGRKQGTKDRSLYSHEKQIAHFPIDKTQSNVQVKVSYLKSFSFEPKRAMDQENSSSKEKVLLPLQLKLSHNFIFIFTKMDYEKAKWTIFDYSKKVIFFNNHLFCCLN